MELVRLRKRFFALLVALVLAVSACGGSQEPSRYDSAQEESQNGQAVAENAVEGASLNQFFPREAAENGGFGFTFTQEKDGFVEASLDRDGSEVALLTISDTTSNPSAAEKYQNSTRQIASFPLYEDETITAVLVGDRFQVQVFSMEDSFTASDRENILQQFNLSGLAEHN